MTKILVLVPIPQLDEEGVSNREAQLSACNLPDTVEVHYRPIRAGGALGDSYHDWLLTDLGLLEAGQGAAEEGYDAVCIDTMTDSGLNALRSVLDIPVIAPARFSYLTALMLGNRFSVLTQWDPWKAMYRKSLQEYGVADKCASIRSINMPPDLRNLLGGKEEVVFPKLLAAAQQCVEDGAEVLCMGSTTMHQAVPYLRESLPIPVVNPGPLTYKMAEVLTALGLSQSRTAYQRPAVPKPEMVTVMLDAASAAQREAGEGDA